MENEEAEAVEATEPVQAEATQPEDAEPEVSPEPVETSDAEVSTEPEEPAVEYDFGSVFSDDFNAESVPESYRPGISSVREAWQNQQQEYEKVFQELRKQAEYHQGLWQQMLRDDDPKKYAGLEDQIEKLQADLRNRQQIVDQIQEERDIVKQQFDDHATKSNAQYLAWVEKKWHDNLQADSQAGSPVLESAEEMIIELQFDPDDALELGFNYGLEAMAEAADFCAKGMKPEDAYALAKRIYSSFVEEPEAAPEPEPVAEHSPSAELTEASVMHRAPERAPKGSDNSLRSLTSDSLDSFLHSTAKDLFSDIRFRRR